MALNSLNWSLQTPPIASALGARARLYTLRPYALLSIVAVVVRLPRNNRPSVSHTRSPLQSKIDPSGMQLIAKERRRSAAIDTAAVSGWALWLHL